MARHRTIIRFALRVYVCLVRPMALVIDWWNPPPPIDDDEWSETMTPEEMIDWRFRRGDFSIIIAPMEDWHDRVVPDDADLNT